MTRKFGDWHGQHVVGFSISASRHHKVTTETVAALRKFALLNLPRKPDVLDDAAHRDIRLAVLLERDDLVAVRIDGDNDGGDTPLDRDKDFGLPNG